MWGAPGADVCVIPRLARFSAFRVTRVPAKVTGALTPPMHIDIPITGTLARAYSTWASTEPVSKDNGAIGQLRTENGGCFRRASAPPATRAPRAICTRASFAPSVADPADPRTCFVVFCKEVHSSVANWAWEGTSEVVTRGQKASIASRASLSR